MSATQMIGATQAAGMARSVPTGKLRLTRRGRLVVTGLATALIAGALAVGGAVLAPEAMASDEQGDPSAFHYVVVQPGSSLWEVATELDPRTDPRDLVAEIVNLNQLGGSGVNAGQPLAVPMRYAENPATIPAAELGL